MGGGDLNMKKSWHPVLLVNQERVWKAEKVANEEKKALGQLRKEREEERQLAELQRMQEASTGKKRVERLDWMYSASGNEGTGALGGARISETMMEDYLLGKRRVDEVLAASDKNVGNTHKDFVAVQNANTARDTAAKIREDPLLAIKRQEEAALRAMANRPDIRRQMKAMQKAGSSVMGEESKEERKARKREEKEERRKDRHERREKRRERDYSPRSDYSDERDRDRKRSYGRDDRDDRERKRYRSDSRSVSPRRRRDDSPRRYKEEDRSFRRSRDDSPRKREDSPRRSHNDRDDRRRSEVPRENNGGRNGHRDHDSRVPPPRDYSNGNGHLNGRSNGHHNGHANGHASGHDTRHVQPHPSRPSASDMAERPVPRPSALTNGSSLDEQRAARLAAMSRNAVDHDSQRTKTLAALEEKRRLEDEVEKRNRAKEGSKENASAAFYQQQSTMSLGESLSRRGGQGLQKNI